MTERQRYDGLGIAMLGLAALLFAGLALTGFIRAPATADDSGVQQSMAWASWAMVVVSLAGGVIGALSLYLIFRTLQAALRSAQAAEEQLPISRKMATDALEVGKKQVRAYMVVEAAYIEARPGPPPQPRVTVKVKNSGQSPASTLSVKLDMRLTFTAEDGTFWFNERKFRADLASGGQDETNFEFAIEKAAGPWLDQWRMAEVVVTVDYRDVFGDWHSEQSRFLWDVGTERQFEGDWPMMRRPLPYSDSNR